MNTLQRLAVVVIAAAFAPAALAVTAPAPLPPINQANYQAYSVTGTCDSAGTMVTYTFFSGSTFVTGNTACSGGSYSLPNVDMSSLPEAPLQFAITQADGGNVARAVTGTVLKDTITPAFVNVLVNDSTPTIKFTIFLSCTENATVTVTVGSLTAQGSCGNGVSLDVSSLPGGTYTATFTIVDAAGNVGASVQRTFNKRLPRNRHHVDFDGSGTGDLAWYHAASGTTGVWLGTENPNNAAIPTYAASVVTGPPSARVVQIADFNGDRKSDLLWRGDAGDYWIGLMDGGTQTSLTKLIDGGSGWEVVDVADLDGDGKVDLLWKHPTAGYGAWMMDGATPTSTGAIAPPGAGFDVKLIADFDGDGREDLLWTHPDGRAAVTLMNGLTVAGSGTVMAAGSGWVPFEAGDLDGDGRSDLLWKRASDNSFQLTLMKGATVSATQVLRTNAPGWRTALPRDTNADGYADIVWQNDSGAVEQWIMVGVQVIQQVPLMAAQPDWWIVASDDYDYRIASIHSIYSEDILLRKNDGTYGMWTMRDSFCNPRSPCSPPGILINGIILNGGTGWEVQPVPH